MHCEPLQMYAYFQSFDGDLSRYVNEIDDPKRSSEPCLDQ